MDEKPPTRPRTPSAGQPNSRAETDRFASAAPNSQEALALSIARAVQHGLPAPDSAEDIRSSVESALLLEACKYEHVLARFRALLAGLVVLGLAGVYASGDSGETIGYAVPVGGLLGAAATVALLGALTRGWYRPWLRLAVPLLDATLVTATFLGFRNIVGDSVDVLPIGSFGAAAAACTIVALSGSLRLSRSAGHVAMAAAASSWMFIWYVSGPHWLTSVATLLLIFSSGLLGGRVTKVIRSVITEQVMGHRLRHMYNDARAATEAREEVLRIVSHDLRNPLGTIGMAADVLLEGRISGERAHRYVGIIKRQGEHMKTLVNDLLDATRIESGNLPISPTLVSVTDLLESVCETMQPLAEDKLLDLHSIVAPDLPPIQVDAARIHQVFSNLIGNAIKFTPDSGHITIKANRSGDKVRFSVTDSGPGIPPDQLQEIFGRMWQANRDGRGIGLGLTIAKAIVEAHGERIGVNSRLDVGTEFWFTVPADHGGEE